MGETYCVRLPLYSPGKTKIQGMEASAKVCILGHAAEFSRENGEYALTVRGIDSEEAARTLLRKLHVGICWASLDLKVGIRASPNPQQVKYFDDPDKAEMNLMLNRPVDAAIDTAYPAVYREKARFAKISAGSVSVTLSAKRDRFFAALKEGLEEARLGVFTRDDERGERIESAIELYVLSHFERNIVPRFLLQCTALEALAIG